MRATIFVLLFACLAALAADDPAPFGVLVLKTGSVVQGRLLKTGDDFEVQLPDSRIFVPGNFVKVQAESLVDAFEALRKELPPEGGEKDRLALARWCITQNLISQARSELKVLLTINPANDSARQLLKKIDEILEPAETVSQDAVAEKLAQSRKGLNEEVPALAGLPKEIGQDFVRRVQPILMNTCAATDCHGPTAPSDFRLQRVNSNLRTTRGPSEKNLLAVLQHVVAEKPRMSPLLTVPQENHGRRGQPLFGGPKGDEQLATLRAWVVRVGRAQLAAAEAAAARKKKTKTDIRPVSLDRPLSDTPLESLDPFDPSEFNRELP